VPCLGLRRRFAWQGCARRDYDDQKVRQSLQMHVSHGPDPRLFFSDTTDHQDSPTATMSLKTVCVLAGLLLSEVASAAAVKRDAGCRAGITYINNQKYTTQCGVDRIGKFNDPKLHIAPQSPAMYISLTMRYRQ
jgi:hypothetical protein